jgi:hypothetical protein
MHRAGKKHNILQSKHPVSIHSQVDEENSRGGGRLILVTGSIIYEASTIFFSMLSHVCISLLYKHAPFLLLYAGKLHIAKSNSNSNSNNKQ